MSLASKFGIPESLLDAAKKALEEANEYQKKVQAHMAKKGIKSLNDLTADQKKKFFNDLDSMHKAKNEEVEPVEEAESHQAKTTMKHINNPTAGEKKAAKDIKPGVAGYRDRIAMLHSAKARGALKKEEVELTQEELDFIASLNHVELQEAVAVTTKPGISVKKEPGRTRAITTHHVVDGQHYKVTSQHDGDDGLHHDIHKVSGKKENRVHGSYQHGVGGYDSHSKPERSGTLDKKVASSLYSAHDRERKKKVHGDTGKHPHELHDDLDESVSNKNLDESSFEKELKDLQRRNREHQRSVNMGHYGSTNGTGISNQEYEKRVKELHRRHNKFQTNINMYGHLGESIEEDVELTLEDIEYIMESEDFQQLDELSKKTLTSYVQKAKADRSAKQNKKSELEGARSMLNQLSAGAKGGGTQHKPGSFRATGPQYERPDVGTNLKKHMPAMHKQLVKMHQKLQADRVETNRVIKKRDAGVKGAESRMERMKTKSYRNEQVDLDELQLGALEAFMQTEEFAQLDELSKETLGNYIKKRQHDVAAQGAITRQHAVDAEKAKKENNYTQQRKSNERSDKAFAKGWNYRQNISRAVDKIVNKG